MAENNERIDKIVSDSDNNIEEKEENTPLLDDIDLLRRREDVNELEDILKANILGGYSRKKVLDYIGSIREQQFKAEEKFRKNLKELIEQKEDLRKRLEQGEDYIKEVEKRNYELSDDIKKFSEGDVGKYQKLVADFENKVLNLDKSIEKLEEEKHNLSAQVQLRDKSILELEDKNKSITSKLLEMESSELQKEKEIHLELEKNIEKLKEELKIANEKTDKHKNIEKEQKVQLEDLKAAFDKLNEAYEASKASIITIQENLIKKEDVINQNCNRYEQQITEIEEKYQSQLSEITSNLEISQKIIIKKDEKIKELEKVSDIKLMDIEKNYQLKVNSLIKNLMDKDQELNQIVKSLEERDYSLKQSQNENKSLEAKSEVFSKNMLETVDKLEEYVEINKNLLKSIEEERKRNTDILKEKLTLEIDFCSAQYKINDMDYEIKTLAKQNEKLAIQIEKERTRAKELILEFGGPKESQ